MADYALEGPKWGASAYGTSGGTVTWTLDASVPSFMAAHIGSALGGWATYGNISFSYTAAATAGIVFQMEAMDGPGGVLGSASYVYSGNSIISAVVTFDSTENWTATAGGVSSASGDDFFVVAEHEIGHAIGLNHYDATAAVMNTVLAPSVAGLTTSDVNGVQALYGTAPDRGLVLTGGAGDDLLLGRGGDDWLIGNDGADILDGDAGNDALDGGAGRDILGGKDGNDLLVGRTGGDHLDGGAGNDTIFGDEGEDLVIGGLGTDHLYGGADSDVFLFRAGDGPDILMDFTPGSAADAVALQYTGLTSFSDVQARLSYFEPGNATVLQIGSDQLFFSGVRPEQLDASDFFFL